MRWPWHLHREWGKRAKQAQAEAEQSRESLRETREKIIGPSESFRAGNHFAEIIHDSLFERRTGR